MKPIDRTSAFIHENYASEGLEVSGTDAPAGCLWVALPAEVTNFSDILAHLHEHTGAVCDIELNEMGATLTVWVSADWPDAAPAAVPPRKSWGLLAAAAVSVLACAVATAAAVLSPARAPPGNATS